MATVLGAAAACRTGFVSTSAACQQDLRKTEAYSLGARSSPSVSFISAISPRISASRKTSCSTLAYEIFGSKLPTVSRRITLGQSARCSPVQSVLENVRPAEVDQSSTPGFQVWLSDVVTRKKRPYFLNRKYTKKDISYAAYMTLVHTLCLAAPFTFSWSAFGCFAGMYVLTGMLGITLSYHRQLSHKSFKTPKWLEYVFAYCGILAVQGDPIEWVSAHRYHHQHCDTPLDPHTPHEGFWHSHMGWLLDDQITAERAGARGNVADMSNDPFYKFIEKTYAFHVVGSAAALFALGGFPFLVWGFAVRAVWVYHITWAVNSAAHVWGTQSWNTGDLSRNNWWVALLAFGEGWHNNHHAFEYSARHGLEWWQFDPTWYTVRLLETLGLATKVRYPTKEHMAKLAFNE
eukprot:jgi/Mesen1/11007/ME000098S10408